MKLAYLDLPHMSANSIESWSGTPFYMRRALQGADIEVVCATLSGQFALSEESFVPFCQSEMQQYAMEAATLLRDCDAQVVLSPFFDPIVYLDCEQPIVLWTDALESHLFGFYPEHELFPAELLWQGRAMERQALTRTRLAIFSSDWAASTAIASFGINTEKVKVVPYGANIDCSYQLTDIEAIIQARSRQVLKLLFMGVNWQRKGGDIVLRVAEELVAAGQTLELTLVGCDLPDNIVIPSYVRYLGRISKSSPQGMEQIRQLFRESHFLFVPSLAEAYGIVFCEASAFAVPSITSYVGGIPTVVKDHINGMKFPLDAPTSVYCDYIMNLMLDYPRYVELALSSFHEYEKRLNWSVATRTVKNLITEIL